jgi:hypothetical protein
VYKVNGSQVVSSRKTGWTDQSTAPSKRDLGAAPSNRELARFCCAMYNDLKSHGLIGN